MVMSFLGACGGVEEDEVVKKERSCERILSYLYGILSAVVSTRAFCKKLPT